MRMLTGLPAHRRRLLLGLVALGGAAVAAPSVTRAETGTPVSQVLRLGGLVDNALQLTAADLSGFAIDTIADTPLRGRFGDTLRVLKGYGGIRLTALLDRAQIKSSEHNDLKKTIVVANATDNYKAVFSWNELYNTAVGEGVYVLVTKDGQALGDEEGRFALISLHDIKTGPRHVRWLADIQVQRIG